jgi:alkylhydroperoxidase family enzyme
VYVEASEHVDDAELANLIGAIVAINARNRVGVGTKLAPEPEHAQAVA